MTITESTRALIIQGLRKKKETRAWLSENLGVNKSWVTKLLNGTLKTLSDEHVLAIERLLDIQFFSMVRKDQHSTSAHQIATLYDENPAIASVIEALKDALSETVYTPRYIPTKEMGKIGNEVIRICYANEDKPGKVARLVLELLK